MTRRNEPPKWNTTKLDTAKLALVIASGQGTLKGQRESCKEAQGARSLAEKTMTLIHRACKASIPRKRQRGKNQPEYWWTEEIAELRKVCLQRRHKATRANKKECHKVTLRATELKIAKKELGKAIKKSKRQKWGTLCQEVDNEPWGLGYKIVTRKLGGMSANRILTAQAMEDIVSALFPTYPVRKDACVMSRA